MSTVDVMSPPPQTVNSPPDMSGWNPFGEDNFSKLTEEELLDREFDLLRASKCLCFFLCLCSFESVLELHPDVHPIVLYSILHPLQQRAYTSCFIITLTISTCPPHFLPTEKPVERSVSMEASSIDRQQPVLQPSLPEDPFGSVPFLANAGKF